MQISVVHPRELGPDDIAAWHSMQDAQSVLASPFLCPEFAVAVGRFRPGARVAVLADGPDIVGFFPHERRRSGVGVPIGAGLTDCQGLVHVPGAEWDAHELLKACRLSVWHFDHLVEGQKAFAPYTASVAPSPVIDLTGGFASYYENLQLRSPQFCRDINRKTRKLEREVGALRVAVGSHDIAELRALLAWKSEQYRRNGWLDIFERRWVTDLVDFLFSMRGERFGGMLSVLYAGGTPVAAHFGLRSGHLLAHWFPSYDMRFSKHSPGLIQHVRMAEEMAAEGVQLIDMGTGMQRYKQTLRSYDLFVAEGIVPRGPLSAGAHRICGAAVGWMRGKARTSPVLFRVADQLLQRLGRIG